MTKNKTAKIEIRLEQREYDLIDARAKSLGISISRYIRRLCRNDLHIPDIERDKDLDGIAEYWQNLKKTQGK